MPMTYTKIRMITLISDLVDICCFFLAILHISAFLLIGVSLATNICVFILLRSFSFDKAKPFLMKMNIFWLLLSYPESLLIVWLILCPYWSLAIHDYIHKKRQEDEIEQRRLQKIKEIEAWEKRQIDIEEKQERRKTKIISPTKTTRKKSTRRRNTLHDD